MVPAPVSAGSRPNIVLIISDDQAWTDYGFMGHPVIRTPHLDRLAERSAVFRRGYVPTALCRPSLATLITGLYASQHGIIGNDPAHLSDDAEDDARRRAALIAKIDACETLPRLLGAAGYRSHQSGKWWEGSFRRGGFTDGMTRGFPEPGGRHGDDGLAIGRKTMEPVLQFIDQAAADDVPFFVWYAPFLPHEPHNPPKRILDRYQTPGCPPELARYYACCEWFDETCGTLLDHLEQHRLTEDTLVVYVTDNGWIQRTADTPVGPGWRSRFAPRSKQSPYEGGVRTPVLLSWPGHIVPSEQTAVVSSIDLFPTILAAAGLEPPAECPGRSLLPFLDGNAAVPERPVFGEGFAHDVIDLNDPQVTLLSRWMIDGRWKLILSYNGRAVRYRFVHENARQGPQLYDLMADPHETTNLADQHPDRVARMARQIAAWWSVDHPPIP